MRIFHLFIFLPSCLEAKKNLRGVKCSEEEEERRESVGVRKEKAKVNLVSFCTYHRVLSP